MYRFFWRGGLHPIRFLFFLNKNLNWFLKASRNNHLWHRSRINNTLTCENSNHPRQHWTNNAKIVFDWLSSAHSEKLKQQQQQKIMTNSNQKSLLVLLFLVHLAHNVFWFSSRGGGLWPRTQVNNFISGRRFPLIENRKTTRGGGGRRTLFVLNALLLTSPPESRICNLSVTGIEMINTCRSDG